MPTPDKSLSLFTSVHNREAKQASTGRGLFSAKMDGEAPAHESGAETFTFIASEPKEDRHRDVVAPDWKLDNFRANPVLPWGHESWLPPVGKGLSVDKDEMGRLMLVAQFDDSPVNPKGQLVAHLYREGFLHAVSVGFISTVATHRSDLEEGNPYAGDRGYLLAGNELLEVSPVTIPALSSALVQRNGGEPVVRSAGDFQRMWRDFYGKTAREETAEAIIERSPSGLTADALIGMLGDPRVDAHLRNLLALPSLVERLAVLEGERTKAAELTLFTPTEGDAKPHRMRMFGGES